MRFRDIPPFTRSSSYRVDVGWSFLEETLKGYAEDAASMGLSFEMDPDFQRAHVWDREKQVRFVEFVLRGGKSALNIYFNCPGWQAASVVNHGRFVLVDGKQRLEAVRSFLRGDFQVFGHYFKQFTDRLPISTNFSVHINDLATDAEVLQWYLDINAGGIAHTNDELDKVRALLEIEKAKK